MVGQELYGLKCWLTLTVKWLLLSNTPKLVLEPTALDARFVNETDKYTDVKAVAAVLAADDYVKIVGDTMSGDLDVNGEVHADNLGNVASVTVSANQTNTGGAYSDVAGVTVNIVLTETCKLKIMVFSTSYNPSVGVAASYYRIVVDGATCGMTQLLSQATANYRMTMAMNYITSGTYAAGTRTVKLQVYTAIGTSNTSLTNLSVEAIPA